MACLHCHDLHYIFLHTIIKQIDMQLPPRHLSMKTAHTVLNPERLREAAAMAVSALKVLANEDRLLLLCQLSQGELCVSEMEEILGIRQPTLSQQLAVLRNEGT